MPAIGHSFDRGPPKRGEEFTAHSMAANLPLSSLLNNTRTADAHLNRSPDTCSTSGRPSVPDHHHFINRKALSMSCKASKSEALSYKTAGVDIDAGNELVRRIQKMNPNIGGFSGMVPFGRHVELTYTPVELPNVRCLENFVPVDILSLPCIGNAECLTCHEQGTRSWWRAQMEWEQS